MIESYNKVVVTDSDGWSKVVPILKPLLYVGSHESSEILIEPSRGPGIAPRHLQLIALPDPQMGYRLANLSDAPVVVSSLPSPLGPRAVGVVGNGDKVQLGGFSLEFRIGSGGPEPAPPPSTGPRPVGERAPAGQQPPKADGHDIGLSLRLAQLELGPDRPIEGAILVRNLGDKPGVQFRIEVQGLPGDCYELEPSPILFPGAEREVSLRLRHPRGPHPLAGEHALSIRATAPDAYPGQSCQVSQAFRLLPYYRHELRFIAAKS
ncbi:MAG: hypothetical protein JXA09_07875 [Anaerolineae bacterium]|nr:hypothetical protein [Anaerolineae bacterium]